MKVISIQEVTVTIADGASIGTTTITTVGNLAQSVVWGSYEIAAFTVKSSSDNWQVDMWLSDASTVSIQRNGTVGLITANVFVIEFHTSVSIQKGTFSLTGTGLTNNIAITAVDLTKSFSVHTWRMTETGQSHDTSPATRNITSVLTTTTNLKFERNTLGASMTGVVNGHWWIAEDVGLTVTQQQFLHNANNPDIDTLAAARSVVLANTFLVGSARTPETVWNDESNLDLKLASTTTVETRDGFDNAVVDVAEAYIVEDSTLTVQQFQVISSTALISGVQAITAVDLSLSIVIPVMPPCTLASANWANGSYDTRCVKLKFDTNAQVSWVRSNGIDNNSTTYLTYNVITFEVAVAQTTEQEGFRFRNDDGSETTATWKANQDINITQTKSATARLRVLTDTVNDSPTAQVTLQYKRTDESASEWRNV